jgi:hypothetical protein
MTTPLIGGSGAARAAITLPPIASLFRGRPLPQAKQSLALVSRESGMQAVRQLLEA